MKKLDARTCSIPCRTPFSTFPHVLPGHYFTMVPVGYDPKRPAGTGPFKYKSFTPGQQSVFVRNDSYFEGDLPYADAVIINDYSDETSQINGLLSREADVIDLLSAGSIGTVKSNGAKVVISHGGQDFYLFYYYLPISSGSTEEPDQAEGAPVRPQAPRDLLAHFPYLGPPRP